MFHTTTCAILAAVVCPVAGASAQDGKAPVAPAQDPGLKKVIEGLETREKALKGLSLRMSTLGSYPSGLTFKTTGTMRVLQRTHFHVRVESAFGTGQEVRSVVERVISPDGVRSYERGPVEEVYTSMDRDLLTDLQTMQAALEAADKASNTRLGLPGPLSGGGVAMLGSAMLRGLDRRFELRVDARPREVDGQKFTVVAGRLRTVGEAEQPGVGDVGPHRVEVLLRPDGIPVVMRQFDAASRQILELRIEDMRLDPELDPASFVLHAPAGVAFKRVMEHSPSRAQIERLRSDYDALDEQWRKRFPLRRKGG